MINLKFISKQLSVEDKLSSSLMHSKINHNNKKLQAFLNIYIFIAIIFWWN